MVEDFGTKWATIFPTSGRNFTKKFYSGITTVL